MKYRFKKKINYYLDLALGKKSCCQPDAWNVERWAMTYKQRQLFARWRLEGYSTDEQGWMSQSVSASLL